VPERQGTWVWVVRRVEESGGSRVLGVCSTAARAEMTALADTSDLRLAPPEHGRLVINRLSRAGRGFALEFRRADALVRAYEVEKHELDGAADLAGLPAERTRRKGRAAGAPPRVRPD
jgi:hypothetical protein